MKQSVMTIKSNEDIIGEGGVGKNLKNVYTCKIGDKLGLNWGCWPRQNFLASQQDVKPSDKNICLWIYIWVNIILRGSLSVSHIDWECVYVSES